MDQVLVEIALDGRIRYAIGALAGLGFAMVGFALVPQFLAEWPAITPRLFGLGFPILGLGMFLFLSFIPAPHSLAIRGDGSAVFTRSVTTWWRFFDIQEILPPGAIPLMWRKNPSLHCAWCQRVPQQLPPQCPQWRQGAGFPGYRKTATRW